MKPSVKKAYSEDDRILCRVCGGEFKHLGSHLWHKHHFKADEYKSMYGLPHNLSLISDEVEAKKQYKFNLNREKYIANLHSEKSIKHRFKKGKKQERKYFARRERERITERLNKDMHGVCAVCNQYFDHLDSHLYNKHKLIRVKEK